MHLFAIPDPQEPDGSLAQAQRFFEHRVEHRRESAGRRIDYPQYLGGRGLLLTRFSKFSLTFGKLTLQIGYKLLGIGERAVGRRAHLRTSSGPTFRARGSHINKIAIASGAPPWLIPKFECR